MQKRKIHKKRKLFANFPCLLGAYFFLKESNVVAFLLEDSVTEISVGWGGGAVAPLLP